jgi:3-methylfumaryl-CoA hydratase
MPYADWIGREARAADVLTPAMLARYRATLDLRAAPDAPPLAHWLCFLPETPTAELSHDGHPRRGGFLPPIDLPRRMWAGGRLVFHHALPVGVPVTRVSTIADVREKTGASGRLVFVTVRHAVTAAGEPVVTEEQDLVYREAARPGAASAPAPPAERAAHERAVVADAALLFRFSALTFNAHRIHYDRDYATGVEGYPGLVVHGPLLATLMLGEWMARTGARPTRFTFRAERPVIGGERFAVCVGEAGRVWVRGAVGARAMSGEVA